MIWGEDRTARRFFLLTVLLCALLTALSCLSAVWGARRAQTLLFKREAEIAGALLKQGVPADVIAVSLADTGGTAAGEALLSRAGRTPQTPACLIPYVRALARSGALRAFLLAAGFSAALLTLCAAWIQRRERRLGDAARIVARYADADFSLRLPQAEEGALGRLMAAVDALATALQAQGETERRNKEFLQRTISDISHQIKTPLAAARLYSEIIEAEPDDPETVTAFCVKTQVSLTRMEELILSLLKIARIDAGGIAFERAVCRVESLVRRAAEELMQRAVHEKKRIELSGPADETALCDAQWTAEAIGNLIKNALDHMGPGGTVRVVWERSPVVLRIRVLDDGEGIAPEELPHIFKRFYRSRSGIDAQGVGLGLPLCRAIVEGQGGLLSVESEPGQGSAFTISFLTNP